MCQAGSGCQPADVHVVARGPAHQQLAAGRPPDPPEMEHLRARERAEGLVGSRAESAICPKCLYRPITLRVESQTGSASRPSSGLRSAWLDAAQRGLLAVGEALGVDAQQDGDTVAGPFGDLGGRDSSVEPG